MLLKLIWPNDTYLQKQNELKLNRFKSVPNIGEVFCSYLKAQNAFTSHPHKIIYIYIYPYTYTNHQSKRDTFGLNYKKVRAVLESKRAGHLLVSWSKWNSQKFPSPQGVCPSQPSRGGGSGVEWMNIWTTYFPRPPRLLRRRSLKLRRERDRVNVSTLELVG